VLGGALLLLAAVLVLVRDFLAAPEEPGLREREGHGAPRAEDARSLATRPAERGTAPTPPAAPEPAPREDATLRGRVVRADAERLPPGWLALGGAPFREPARLVPLDGRGEFETKVVADPEKGAAWGRVLLEGFPPTEWRASGLLPGKPTDVTVEVPSPPPVRARVVDPSGGPLRGATILLVASDFDDETLSVEGETLEAVLARLADDLDFDGFVRTDEDGAFEYRADVRELAGFTLDRRWLVEGVVDPRTRHANLRAQQNGGVEVRFTDAATGGAARGILVVQARRSSGGASTYVGDRQTLEWFFPTDGTETVALVVESARYRRRETTLTASAPRRPAEVALEPRAANEVGRVVLESEFRDLSGAPVPLAVSWILEEHERSEELEAERGEGGSTVVTVPAGVSALRAHPDAPFGGLLRSSASLRVPAGGETAWRPAWPLHGSVRLVVVRGSRGVFLEGPLDAGETSRELASYASPDGDPYVREGTLQVPALPTGRWVAESVPSKGPVEFTVVAGREVTVDLR
jgi:hypothetical protein